MLVLSTRHLSSPTFRHVCSVMLAQITRWPFQQLRSLRRWLRNCYRKRLKFCLFIYFLLVACYKLLEIVLVNVDLFDVVPSGHANGCSQAHLACQQSNSPAIDAIYTWVNGSDSRMLTQLRQTSNRLAAQKLNEFCLSGSEFSSDASLSCTLLPLMLIRPWLPNPQRYFDDVLKFEKLNDSASLIYLHNLNAARSLGVSCVHIIDGQLYKLTNLYRCDNSQAHHLLINSLFVLTTVHGQCDIAWSDPLKGLLPLTRKQLQSLQLESNRTFLYTSKFTSSNLSKIVSLAKVKENASSSDCNFHLEFPLPAQLTDVNFFHHQLENENMRQNRFADHDELKYSLRSLERFAPWIRHVFIVTNGQIPNWLNVQHHKLRIIQHQDIFPNKSHLPTFSSSAIECHLHRIPNLSKRFLYLNDDIIIGDHIYPDDFYTQSKGFKVYLSWPVPNCAEGCPLNWLNDGYCDKACNSSKCLWDGGDCLHATNVTNESSVSASQLQPASFSTKNSEFCASNCLTNWLGDSFCDQVCNKPECAYDMADCGVNHFEAFEQIEVNQTGNVYTYSVNSSAIFLNFTNFVNQPVNERYYVQLFQARYFNSSCIFSAVLNLKHNILTVLFHPNTTTTGFNLEMNAKINQKRFNFSIFIDKETSPSREKTTESFNLTKLVQSMESAETLAQYDNKTDPPIEVVNTIATIATIATDNQALSIPSCDIDLNTLPVEIREKFEQIDKQRNEGIVTDEGKGHFYSQLKQLYSNIICENSMQSKMSTNPIGQFLESYLAGNQSESYRSRRLLDAYADSLIYVNHLYNKVFGVQSRQVVAHMPHFIDAEITSRLQAKFAEYFEQTSASQLRNSKDMQFSFSYFHFLMSETEESNVDASLRQFDTDQSGTLSLNELKTLAIHLTGLPLTDENSQKFYTDLSDCYSIDGHLPLGNTSNRPIWQQELLIDLSIDLLLNCTPLREKIAAKWTKLNRNKYEILNDDEVAFKMLRSNESILEKDLNELRAKKRKFMCLNDNLEHGVNATVDASLRRMLQQFFTSLLPVPSNFELPPGKVNRFLYIDQYNTWKHEVDQKSDLFIGGSYLFIFINLILFIKMLLQ